MVFIKKCLLWLIVNFSGVLKFAQFSVCAHFPEKQRKYAIFYNCLTVNVFLNID